MKKILVVLLMICICLSGCSNKDEEIKQPSVGKEGSTWDCVEYETIEKMNEAAKTNIASAPIAGKSNEWFGVIAGNLAQYKFEANGEEWCIRASKDVDNDISGIYDDSITFEKDIESMSYTDDYYVFRFFYDNTQYVISLNVAGKDVSMSHFNDVCYEFKTNITGVKSGYENEIIEDGDNVIMKTIMYNDDGTTTIMETVYTFNGDKMVSIMSNVIFENEDLAKEYYDTLIENGMSTDGLVLDGVKISSDMSSNVEDFYGDITKDVFIKEMTDSINQ